MDEKDNKAELVINVLQERVKELNCLYRIEKILQNQLPELSTIFIEIVRSIPAGWYYPEICQAIIVYEGIEYKLSGYHESEWRMTSDIVLQGVTSGYIGVSYTKATPEEDEGPFLKEERKLLDTIAERLGGYILQKQIRKMLEEVKSDKGEIVDCQGRESKIITDLLLHTDHGLYIRIARKLLNYLYRNRVQEASELLRKMGFSRLSETDDEGFGANIPSKRGAVFDSLDLSREIFRMAEEHLSDEEFVTQVQRWMQEDKANFLVEALNNRAITLDEISDKLRRFQQISSRENLQLSDAIRKSFIVNLIRKLMTGQLRFIRITKQFVEMEDFFDLLPQMIFPKESIGMLGGKGCGLFLASQIIKKMSEEYEELKDIKVPKTYYVTSDGLHKFLSYNQLEDIIEQKYKDIAQVRQEYPHIIEIFKKSSFPPEIVQKLALALDDFGDAPLIVRSSSLLEDRLGSAFSGKYQSFFLGNQGSKRDKLEALLDAIAEVYASTFSPDPIEYRTERELIDSQEEMGVLIQEVVGRRIGPYFLPAFAGVAFSNNEFRWSPRIKREDGLIRIVPGLGTRAVDRLSDDYPILIAPGQPNLRVNVTEDEIVRYSPHKLDVINLENNSFETVDLVDFIRKYGDEFPRINRYIELLKDGHLQRPSLLDADFEGSEPVVTFGGLIKDTVFVKQMGTILTVLQEKMEHPVDIEFASDGEHFYLLQCRPQSYGSRSSKPAPIPKDIPESAILFTANRHISNGFVPDITHIVYVDPQRYSEISDRKTLMDVGRAVSGLNARLPKHQFILMGPGRWGSRGDIKLGVNVTYSDINNTAVLVEIARKKGNYVPDLSFGTHFFQDLVEAEIRYLPLYPDDQGIIFNERFLHSAANILTEILPEYGYLTDTLRVIDLPSITRGKILRVLMNADLDEAVGILTQPSARTDEKEVGSVYVSESAPNEHWVWRMRMVECLAECIDPERFGIKAFYIFGSTKNGTAGPESDVDLLLHFAGNEEQMRQLFDWFEGWSRCLDEFNYLRTGYRTGGLLDVHLVTDEDIERRSSYAVKIGAVTDAAREIPMRSGCLKGVRGLQPREFRG